MSDEFDPEFDKLPDQPPTAERVTGQFTLPSPTYEYQATLTCLYFKNGACTNCRRDQNDPTFVVAHPDGPFTTEAAAQLHGQGMKRKVYGLEHKVTVQRRIVGAWVNR